MLIFIDESGDPGFKIERGSSPYFVICCVCFEKEEYAEQTASYIKNFAVINDLKSELKFNKLTTKFRSEFFAEVKDAPFRIHSIVFNKKEIYSSILRNSKERFYNYATRKILDAIGGQIANSKIKIDGGGSKEFRQELQKYLKAHLNSRFSKFGFVDSKSNVLIQLADMCAGAIHRSQRNDKKDSNIYLDILKPRIENIWFFK